MINEMPLRFLQEGTHGCVLEPQVPCRRGIKTSARTVGKIVRAKNAEPEIKMAKLIEAIPGYERYYVHQEKDNCDARNFGVVREQFQSQCKVLRKDDALVQLVSPYAGATVRSLGLTSSFDFIGSLRHVLEGIANLEKQGICHFDLHEGNVLVDFRGTFRIIDFGSAFVGDQINEKGIMKHMYAFEPEFPPQPPEFSVQNGVNEGLSLYDSIKQTMQQKKVFGLAQKLLGLTIAEQEKALTNFWREDTTWEGDSWVPFVRSYWRTYDPWSIGVMFTNLLQKSFLLQSFVTVTWPGHQESIRKVLKGLLCANPKQRMTATEALTFL